MKKEETCCFTGHRPTKLPWGEDESDPRCVGLKRRLEDALEDAYADGARHFICGMALGSDFYFCEAVLKLRDKYGSITVEAALPCEEQSAHWKERDRQRYFALIARCDYETMVQRLYDRQCMQRRDRYMVDRSARVIAVYGGIIGGTMYTLSYAMKKGLEVVLLSLEEEGETARM
ncbi:hypothetical protein SDC9_109498 [bioreactor metagenome]|uniref:DUF1273 domain-containing protein n=1 Tax=bioreactor metagenome TaxID=1076179 RepID=A0A645BBC7_9ZZZZ